MSDIELILLILAAFYLYECAFWMRPGSVLFRSFFGQWRHRMCVLHSSAVLRNDQGGLVFGNLLPLGNSSLCPPWPVSLSPQGVYSYVSQANTPDGRPEQIARYVRFEDVRSVETSHQEVLVNGSLLARTGSASLARHLAALIKKIASLKPSQREAAIDAALRGLWNVEKIREGLQRVRRRARTLKISGGILFLYLFGYVPARIYVDPAVPFLDLVAPYVFLLALMMFHYLLAHRALSPKHVGERTKHLLLMLISPADAIHSADGLFRDLLSVYHPLAAAYALCSGSEFQEFARHVVLDLRFPLLPLCPSAEAEPQAVEGWFRSRMREAVERFLRETNYDPDKLAAPPPPENNDSISYCPRCHGQYVLNQGACSTCGLALRRFEAAHQEPRTK